jgi:YQGE family putative transporter
MLGVFVLLLWKQTDIVEWFQLLGMLYGSSVGLYYSGFNLVSFFLTGEEGRDQFFSWEQIINRTVSLLTPLLFSLVVLWLGYNGTFGIVTIILGISIVFTFFIPKMTMDFTILNLKYQEVWQEYKTVLVSITGFGFLQSWIQIASKASAAKANMEVGELENRIGGKFVYPSWDAYSFGNPLNAILKQSIKLCKHLTI